MSILACGLDIGGLHLKISLVEINQKIDVIKTYSAKSSPKNFENHIKEFLLNLHRKIDVVGVTSTANILLNFQLFKKG